MGLLSGIYLIGGAGFGLGSHQTMGLKGRTWPAFHLQLAGVMPRWCQRPAIEPSACTAMRGTSPHSQSHCCTWVENLNWIQAPVNTFRLATSCGWRDILSGKSGTATHAQEATVAMHKADGMKSRVGADVKKVSEADEGDHCTLNSPHPPMGMRIHWNG